MKEQVVILGTRGSVPVSGPDYLGYGGGTTCVLVRLAGQPLVLDAGTGILDLPGYLRDGERDLPLLLSHPHADHLLGLPMCPLAFDRRRRLDVYTAHHGGLDGEAQIRALMAPPLWPVGPDKLPARVCFHTLKASQAIGPVRVDTMDGDHPGGVTVFRLSGGGKRVVFATDCTLSEGLLPALTGFARGCDLLLIDGQYSPEEWESNSRFGHSTWIDAVRLGAACGAAQVRVIHHHPARTDRELDGAASQLTDIHPGCAFARAGEEIIL